GEDEGCDWCYEQSERHLQRDKEQEWLEEGIAVLQPIVYGYISWGGDGDGGGSGLIEIIGKNLLANVLQHLPEHARPQLLENWFEEINRMVEQCGRERAASFAEIYRESLG